MFHLRRHFEIKPKKTNPNLNLNPNPNPKPNLNPGLPYPGKVLESPGFFLLSWKVLESP